jgi:hypothetical protein
MKQNPLEILYPTFEFLTKDLGFRIVSSTDHQVFDNVTVILSSEDGGLTFEIARDRGGIFTKIGRSLHRDECAGLNLIRVLVMGLDPVSFGTVEEQADFLRNNYSKVHDMFSPRNFADTMDRLKRLRMEGLKKMYPGKVAD